jgi:hypothetical protein
VDLNKYMILNNILNHADVRFECRRMASRVTHGGGCHCPLQARNHCATHRDLVL